ncbi:MAG TPA: cation:proton antiporter [Nostocaceae cyanobacterium]|nr:cation:proton antiporter [Nostocaceae cyanobacterium]
MELLFSVLSKEAIVPFAILLVVILVVPTLFKRLRLPGLVGLVCSGVLLGPSGWHLFQSGSPILNLLSDIGLVYLLFITGLEFDLQLFRQQQSRALGFGIVTFILPLFVGAFIGHRLLGFNWNTSILIGSLLASYTLLAYPIISRLGVVNNEAITVTVGATIVNNLGTFLLLAVCLSLPQAGELSMAKLGTILGEIIIYFLIILEGFNWLGQEFFRRSGDDEANKFLFVFLSVFLAAGVAQLLGIEKIIGVFLAGIAVNKVVGEGPVKEKLMSIGSWLFIPIFFVDLGLLISVPGLFAQYRTIELLLLILAGLLVSKFMATVLAKLIYHYNWQETLTMWSLSVPLVGTTLAVAVVGYEAKILPPEVFNMTIALSLITSLLGTWLTNRLAVGVTRLPMPEAARINLFRQNSQTENSNLTIVVPICHPQTQPHLIEMAALLARQVHGKIIPLVIATATSQMDAPQLETTLQHSELLLTKAIAQSQQWAAEAEPLLRIDDAFAPAVTRAAREQQASLIIMGWGKPTGFRGRLFGDEIDSVIWAAHCPVLVSRLMESPKRIQRILVPVENLTDPSFQSIQFAQIIADANQAQVTLLNVCDRRTKSQAIANRRDHLSRLVSNLALANPPEIQIIVHENATQAILQAARLYDLVIFPFHRHHTSPGGLAINDVTTQLAKQLTCSIIILGEPQRQQPTVLTTNIVGSTAKV